MHFWFWPTHTLSPGAHGPLSLSVCWIAAGCAAGFFAQHCVVIRKRRYAHVCRRVLPRSRIRCRSSPLKREGGHRTVGGLCVLNASNIKLSKIQCCRLLAPGGTAIESGHQLIGSPDHLEPQNSGPTFAFDTVQQFQNYTGEPGSQSSTVTLLSRW